ncbi:hypothetical protein CDD83_5761 [Cordyceps sp. RAO-2017]|nr:hypothetical protein CDD83_5761 [Cordyceps sp. RAO-2017]
MRSYLLLSAWALAQHGLCAVRLESAPVLPDGWEQLSEAPPAEAPYRLGVALRRPQTHDRLKRSIASQAHLSAADVRALRKPPKKKVEGVRRWLADHGVTDVRRRHDWLDVGTSVGTAERLLGTKLHYYSYRGRRPVVRAKEYFVPDALAPSISFVHPVTNFMSPMPRPAPFVWSGRGLGLALGKRRAGHGLDCAAAIVPECLFKLYNMSYATPDGKSPIRLGVAGFLDQYANSADTHEFLRETVPAVARTGHTFAVELAHGGCNPQNRSLAGTEANLDVQYALALAHPAQVVFYSVGGQGTRLDGSGVPYPQTEPPDPYAANEPWLDLVEHLLAKPDDQVPHVLSLSYADNEQSVPRAYAERVCHLFGLLTARGTSVIGGSGDGGARGAQDDSDTCHTNDAARRPVTVPTFPSTCPWVTSVGSVTTYLPDPQGANFSTGGFSLIFGREPWQDAAVEGYVRALDGHLSGYYNSSMRAIPDLAVAGTRFLSVVNGLAGVGSGTSYSTPVFASMIALVNDARVRRGKRVLGWLNERLYSAPVRAVLRDITAGESLSCVFPGGAAPGGWPAKRGWDAITGLGAPADFDDLMRVLVDL